MSGQESEQDVSPPTPTEKVGTLVRLSDGREFRLGVGGLRVGRDSNADVVLSDRTVSRHHADIRYENGRYVLYDHSSNGTWVNDALVVVAKPLRHGDGIRFGAVDFRYQLKDVPRHEATAPVRPEPEERVSQSSTVRMKGGKPRPRRRGGLSRVLIGLAAVVLLVVAAAGAIYFFFPDLADRLIARLPAAIRVRLGG